MLVEDRAGSAGVTVAWEPEGTTGTGAPQDLDLEVAFGAPAHLALVLLRGNTLCPTLKIVSLPGVHQGN